MMTPMWLAERCKNLDITRPLRALTGCVWGPRSFGAVKSGMSSGNGLLQILGELSKGARQRRGSGDQNIVMALAP